MNNIAIYNCVGEMIYEEKNNLKGVIQMRSRILRKEFIFIP